MKDPHDYTGAIMAGFASAIFIFFALVLFIKSFKSKHETRWRKGKDGVWEFCNCGDCKICKPGKV